MNPQNEKDMKNELSKLFADILADDKKSKKRKLQFEKINFFRKLDKKTSETKRFNIKSNKLFTNFEILVDSFEK